MGLLLFGQSKDIERVPSRGMMDVGGYQSGDLAWAAAAHSCRDADVLLAADAEREREALHRSSEADVEEDLAAIGVERAEVAVEVAGESNAARCRKHGCEERGALLVFPEFLHRADIVGGQFPDVAV